MSEHVHVFSSSFERSFFLVSILFLWLLLLLCAWSSFLVYVCMCDYVLCTETKPFFYGCALRPGHLYIYLFIVRERERGKKSGTLFFFFQSTWFPVYLVTVPSRLPTATTICFRENGREPSNIVADAPPGGSHKGGTITCLLFPFPRVRSFVRW